MDAAKIIEITRVFCRAEPRQPAPPYGLPEALAPFVGTPEATTPLGTSIQLSFKPIARSGITSARLTRYAGSVGWDSLYVVLKPLIKVTLDGDFVPALGSYMKSANQTGTMRTWLSLRRLGVEGTLVLFGTEASHTELDSFSLNR